MAKVSNKTKGFNSISREVVFDNELSDRARFLYVYMACKPEGWEFYQDKVAEEIGYKKDTLRKYLDELITRGWITEEEQRNSGKFGCLDYIIEIKRRVGNLPIRENTVSEKNRNGKNHNQRNIDNISSIQSISDKRDIENKKILSNDNQKKVFVKPTIEQIEEYIKEKGYHFDAEQFWNHYESVGWMIGKNHMKDWHCACATWEGRRKKGKEEKEEPTEESVYPEGMDEERWTKIAFWLCANVSRISGRISPMDFDMMRKKAGDSQLMRDILVEINDYVELHDGVDIMQKFDELLNEHRDG